jgi:hypothetical protein
VTSLRPTTSLWLCRRLRQVARPPCSFGVVNVRSLHLSSVVIFGGFPGVSVVVLVRSPTTFFWLRRRLRQVARPPSGFVATLVRSLDLPTALSSPSPVRKTSPDFASGVKASVWGGRIMALPSTPGAWVRFVLRPSRGRHASSGSARLL